MNQDGKRSQHAINGSVHDRVRQAVTKRIQAGNLSLEKRTFFSQENRERFPSKPKETLHKLKNHPRHSQPQMQKYRCQWDRSSDNHNRLYLLSLQSINLNNLDNRSTETQKRSLVENYE
jgi:hypothetical protein